MGSSLTQFKKGMRDEELPAPDGKDAKDPGEQKPS
jgi:hypothetical protein